MGRKLILGNWKMNGSLARNDALLRALTAVSLPDDVDVGVCVPFPYLAQTQALLEGSSVSLGAQNVSEFVDGAYTGEVSALMLQEFGCRYVILGHSERRALFHESDADVLAKVRASQAAGLVPVLCCGETLEERRAGASQAVVSRQLGVVAEGLTAQERASLVIAYEPVWAIGTGLAAEPDEVEAMHAWVRQVMAVERLAVLYGGSVKAANASELFGGRGVDGALVGGASLVAEEFIEICRAGAAGRSESGKG